MITWSFNIATGRPAVCLTIERIDGTTERVTSATYPLTVDGNTFRPMAGLQIGRYTQRADGTLPSFGFSLKLPLSGSGPLLLRDVHREKYLGAIVTVSVVSAANPTALDLNHKFKMLGNITYDIHGMAELELVSLYAIPRDIFVRVFTLLCDVEFGDPVTCKIPTFPYSLGRHLQDVSRNEAVTLGAFRRVRFAANDTPDDYANVYLECTTAGTTAGSAPSFSSTVGATTSDGTAVWTTRNAWARYAQVASVATNGHEITLTGLPDPRASDSTWYHPASILFATGEYKGRRFKCGIWNPATFTIKVYLPCGLAAANDWLEIAPDCEKTISMCKDKYDNADNYRGFVYQQGAKAQAMQLGYPE